MKAKIFRMSLITAIISLSAGGIFPASGYAAPATSVVAPVEETVLVRHTTEGLVRGVIENNGRTQAYLGVPYAQPPVGQLRWKAPEKPSFHGTVLDANKVPAKALQISKGKATGSDDCLYLNIWRPNTKQGYLPVLVFLHGGNNQTGASTAASYGKALAANANAVVIGLNYRLGPLGFIELPALKHGTPEENSGNFTLLDINAALDWVKANIVNFGGNPNNITLAGHSAGGRDVMAILTSPMFKGKFQKAMSFSGSQTMSSPEWSEKIHAKAFAKLALEDGKATNESEALAWVLKDSAEVRDWLYSLKPERIVALMSGAKIRMRVFPHLFADGQVLPKAGFGVYDSTATARNVSNVPLLLLADTTEFKFYTAVDPYFSKAVADKTVLTNEELHAQYAYASGYGSQFFGYANTQQSIERIQKHTKGPIYAALFNWGTNSQVVGEEMAFVHGAKHGIHMDFIFSEKKFDLQKKYPQAYKNNGVSQLSKLVQSYIGNFLHQGNPNGSGLASWKAWSKNATFMKFDADVSKASAQMTNFRYEPKKLLSAMEKDDTVSPEAKSVLLHKVMDGRFFSSPIDEHFGNPAHIMK